MSRLFLPLELEEYARGIIEKCHGYTDPVTYTEACKQYALEEGDTEEAMQWAELSKAVQHILGVGSPTLH